MYAPFFKGIVLTFPNKFIENHIIIATKGNKIASNTKKIKCSHFVYGNEFNMFSVNNIMSSYLLTI